MSTVRANNYYDASGGSAAQLYGVSMRNGGTAWVNRIINGDMRIDQRNAGAVYTPTGGAITYGSVDRWQFAASAASKYTVQRNAGSVTPPAGFTNYLGAVSSSAYSVGSTEQFNILQAIEGFNTADLGWGAAGAQTVTLSFWVRSSLTGTFGGVLSNDGKSRTYPFTYTISAANTWEYKTLTIAGDTTGTWNTTTGVGIYVTFGLGVGSSASATAGAWTGTANIFGATGATSVVGTNGATWYVTGVQLEAGTVASPFERRDYGRELMMCQRYARAYDSNGIGCGVGISSTDAVFHRPFDVEMRAAATATVSGTIRISDDYSADYTAASPSVATINATISGVRIRLAGFSGLTTGRFVGGYTSGSDTGKVILSAEL